MNTAVNLSTIEHHDQGREYLYHGTRATIRG